MANIARDGNFAHLKRKIAELKHSIDLLETDLDAIYNWDKESESKALGTMIASYGKQVRELIDSVYIRGED